MAELRLSPNTHPIGPDTVNRTANLHKELDARLGRAVVLLGEKSRGEIIRKAVREYLDRAGVAGLILIFWGGSAVVVASGVFGGMEDLRRTTYKLELRANRSAAGNKFEFLEV